MQATGHVTIEKTAKTFKIQHLLSSLVVTISFVLVLTCTQNAPALSVLGLFGMVGGATWYFVNKFRIWWNHG